MIGSRDLKIFFILILWRYTFFYDARVTFSKKLSSYIASKIWMLHRKPESNQVRMISSPLKWTSLNIRPQTTWSRCHTLRRIFIYSKKLVIDRLNEKNGSVPFNIHYFFIPLSFLKIHDYMYCILILSCSITHGTAYIIAIWFTFVIPFIQNELFTFNFSKSLSSSLMTDDWWVIKYPSHRTVLR